MINTYIALFRGINVGGKNILPMRDLRALLGKLGAKGVNTYLQSGNAVFRYDMGDVNRLGVRIGSAIRESHGFEPHVFLLDVAGLEKAVKLNPFPEAVSNPKSVHVFFLDSVPVKPDLGAIERMKKGNERYLLKEDLFYLHAPDGVGRSQLAARAEKAFGVRATARNWRSVCEIQKLAKQVASETSRLLGGLSHIVPPK